MNHFDEYLEQLQAMDFGLLSSALESGKLSGRFVVYNNLAIFNPSPFWDDEALLYFLPTPIILGWLKFEGTAVIPFTFSREGLTPTEFTRKHTRELAKRLCLCD